MTSRARATAAAANRKRSPAEEQFTMMRSIFLSSLILLLPAGPCLRADEIPPEYRAAISKGLDWVAKTQARA